MKDIPKVDKGCKIRNFDYDDLNNYYLNHGITPMIKIINKKYLEFDFDITLGKEVPQRMKEVEISKKAFSNNMSVTMRYVNYFIEYFDEDNELILAYLLLMFSIMKKDDDFSPESLIFTLRNYITSDTMIEKIVKMVEYNIKEELMRKEDKKYDESTQLTTDHLKCIMAISIVHKMIIPILSHYCKVRKNLMGDMNEKQLYFKAFTCFLDVFDDAFNVNFYSKIHHTATTRVAKTETNQKLMWERLYRSGITNVSYVNTLIRDLFIEISQKAIFDQSAIIFIHVCFDMSIKNKLRDQDKFEMSDMKMEVSDAVNEEISRFDKFLISNARVSERDIFKSKAIIKDMLLRYDKKISEEEFAFYRKNLSLDDSQLMLVYNYYAAKVGSYDILSHITADDLIKMIIMMKRKLTEDRFIYLPHIISGVLDKTTAKRYSRNKITSLFNKHPLKDELADKYKDAMSFIDIKELINDAKILISCKLSIVDYEASDKLGTKININDTAAMDEIFHLLNSI